MSGNDCAEIIEMLEKLDYNELVEDYSLMRAILNHNNGGHNEESA